MTLDDIETAANTAHLTLVGVAEDRIALLGPMEPGFWAHFTQSPEWNDGQADPMDRWSDRVVTALAHDLGAKPRFPFAPDTAPFLTWAMHGDGAWQSPVGMLVQRDAGLLISYRGALEFDAPIGAFAGTKPCTDCARPCETACPVGALTPDGYDIPTCKAHLQTAAGAACLMGGCLVRRACPVSQSYGRDPAQSGYHMQRFLG